MSHLTRRPALLLAAALLFLAGAAAHAQSGGSLDPREFRLTMDVVRSYLAASENLYEALHDDPTLLDDLEDVDEEEFGSEPELRAMVDAMTAEPAVRAAIEAAGISVREYALVNATLIPAYITSQLVAAGFDTDMLPAWINEQHMQFAEENAAEIAQLFESLEDMASFDDDDW